MGIVVNLSGNNVGEVSASSDETSADFLFFDESVRLEGVYRALGDTALDMIGKYGGFAPNLNVPARRAEIVESHRNNGNRWVSSLAVLMPTLGVAEGAEEVRVATVIDRNDHITVGMYTLFADIEGGRLAYKSRGLPSRNLQPKRVEPVVRKLQRAILGMDCGDENFRLGGDLRHKWRR